MSMEILQREYDSQIDGQESVIYNLQNELVSLKLENEEQVNLDAAMSDERNNITIEIQSIEVELHGGNQQSQVSVGDNHALAQSIEVLKE